MFFGNMGGPGGMRFATRGANRRQPTDLDDILGGMFGMNMPQGGTYQRVVRGPGGMTFVY